MCVSVPSSPIRIEGLGGGAVTFLVAEWPRGRGWVVMAMGIVFVGGGTACLSTPCSHTPASPGCREGLVCAEPSWGEGLDLCPQRPRGKGGGAQEPEGYQVWGKILLRFTLGPHPHSWVCLGSFPVSLSPQIPSQAFCSCLYVLITACACLSLSCLLLGPQSTWPPGLCPAGSQAAGAVASVAGSCSPHTTPSSAWLELPVPDLGDAG